MKKLIVVALMVVVGAGFFVDSSHIYDKAKNTQVLIEDAWDDTWLAVRLQMLKEDVEQFITTGTTGKKHAIDSSYINGLSQSSNPQVVVINYKIVKAKIEDITSDSLTLGKSKEKIIHF